MLNFLRRKGKDKSPPKAPTGPSRPPFIDGLEIVNRVPTIGKYFHKPAMLETISQGLIFPGSQVIASFDHAFDLGQAVRQVGDLAVLIRTVAMDRGPFLRWRNTLIQNSASRGLSNILEAITHLMVPEMSMPEDTPPMAQREALVWSSREYLKIQGQDATFLGRVPVHNIDIGSLVFASYSGLSIPENGTAPVFNGAGGDWMTLAQIQADPIDRSTLMLPDGKLCAFWHFVPKKTEGWSSLADLLELDLDFLLRIHMVNGEAHIGFMARTIISASYAIASKYFDSLTKAIAAASVRVERVQAYGLREAFHTFIPGTSRRIPDLKTFSLKSQEGEESLYATLLGDIETILTPGRIYAGSTVTGKPAAIDFKDGGLAPVGVFVGPTGSGKSSAEALFSTQLYGPNRIGFGFNYAGDNSDRDQVRILGCGKHIPMDFLDPSDKKWRKPPNFSKDQISRYLSDERSDLPLSDVELFSARELTVARAMMLDRRNVLQWAASLKSSWMKARRPIGLPLFFQPANSTTEMVRYTYVVSLMLDSVQRIWDELFREHPQKIGLAYKLDDIAMICGGLAPESSGRLSKWVAGRVQNIIMGSITYLRKVKSGMHVVIHDEDAFDPAVGWLVGTINRFPWKVTFYDPSHHQATLWIPAEGRTWRKYFEFDPYLQPGLLKEFCTGKKD